MAENVLEKIIEKKKRKNSKFKKNYFAKFFK